MGECIHDNDVIATVVAYCWVWVDGERDFIASSVLFRVAPLFQLGYIRFDVVEPDIAGLVKQYSHDIFLTCVCILCLNKQIM